MSRESEPQSEDKTFDPLAKGRARIDVTDKVAVGGLSTLYLAETMIDRLLEVDDDSRRARLRRHDWFKIGMGGWALLQHAKSLRGQIVLTEIIPVKAEFGMTALQPERFAKVKAGILAEAAAHGLPEARAVAYAEEVHEQALDLENRFLAGPPKPIQTNI